MGFSSPRGFSMIMWVNPLMFTILLIFFWIQLKGYVAFAVSDSYFRDALLASASALGFSIEETMSRLKIKETGEEIQVAVQGSIGTGQLKSPNKISEGTVRDIVNGMTEYFQRTPGRMNYMTSYLYLLIGCLIAAMSAWMFALDLE